MPTLYIIDGYAQFFRAYHAIRTPMTSPVTKEPTNMTFGFVGMLLKLLKGDGANLSGDARAEYVALALDVGGDHGTFRSQIYPEYKAHRDPPPEDLFPQVERCLAMLREIGLPIIGVEGFEADDVFATMVDQLRAKHPDLCIRMISKDKDLKQLLETRDGRPMVELFDVHNDTPYSAEALAEDTGLAPGQVVDMLTLMGDTVDNVPGVEGVGEKTAAALVKEWGTLDNLLAHADQIKGKRGERLREAIPRLPLSKTLVTLRRDVPMSFELESARVSALKLDRMIPVLKECGFNRYQEDVRVLAGLPAAAPSQEVTGASAGLFGGAPTPKPKKVAPDPIATGGLFGALEPPQTRHAQSGSYEAVLTEAALREVVAKVKAARVVAVDTETTGLSPLLCDLCGVSLSIEPGTGWYIPVRSPEPARHLDTKTALEILRPVLEDATLAKCGHNLKYDMLVLRAHGVRLRGITAPGGLDSMVGSYLIDASRSSHSLDALALALLGRTNISLSELIGSGKDQRTFDTVPLEQATQYAAEDADVALQLQRLMMPQLEAMDLAPLLNGVETPLVEVLAELEWNGVLVEPAELDRQRARLEKQIGAIVAQLNEESRKSLGRTIDPDSPKQLAAALFNGPEDDVTGLGIKPLKKTKTGVSTDAEVLEKLGEDPSITTPIPRLILEYRQLSKLVSTYLVALKEAINPKTGRIHSSFNQTVAATGRLASSDPNLQNIPIRTDVGREIRRAFIAPEGCALVTADYSQIELRLLAHLSRDPALIEAFHAGADIHTAVAAQIANISPMAVTKEQRSGAKMVNFGIVYGITAFGLARRLNIGEREAAEIINGYKRKFAGITTFLQECVEQARTRGFVETMLRRRRPIPDIDSTNQQRRALAERLSINSVVQGSAADLIKLAMVNIHRKVTTAPEWSAAKMLLQIHDELVFECPREMAERVRAMVVEEMEGAMKLSVPLRADAHIGRDWFEGK
ncbi:MAG: DNA polymerase I [Phycisphaerales bacterium]